MSAMVCVQWLARWTGDLKIRVRLSAVVADIFALFCKHSFRHTQRTANQMRGTHKIAALVLLI